MTTHITYSLAAAMLISAAYVYAGGACGRAEEKSSAGSQAHYATDGSCGSKTAEECATKCAKGCTCDESCPGKSAAAPAYSTIDTEGLKQLLLSGEPVAVVDARSGKHDDGQRIPGAVSLAATASDKTIARVLPDKHAKIVTYCSNQRCPASSNLAKRLVQMGYTNVHKYPDGIAGWTAAGNPVTTVAAN